MFKVTCLSDFLEKLIMIAMDPELVPPFSIGNIFRKDTDHSFRYLSQPSTSSFVAFVKTVSLNSF